MTFDDYLLHLFYLFDTELEALNLTPRALRLRGPAPALCDSEVLTIEAAGEFLGIATDAGLYEHFRRYHSGAFPALPRVTRTTFLRQAANLWAVKRLLHERLLRRLPAAAAADPLSIVDSFALHVCRFTRARKCRLFKGRAAYGFDAAEHHHFYGFRVHLRCSCQGAVLAVELAPGNVADLPMVHELAPPACGGRAPGRPQLLVPARPRRAGARAGGAADGPVPQAGDRPCAPAVDAPGAPAGADRDGQRAVGRAVRLQADLGPGHLAPVFARVAQGPGPHGRVPDQRPAGQPAPATGPAPGGLT